MSEEMLVDAEEGMKEQPEELDLSKFKLRVRYRSHPDPDPEDEDDIPQPVRRITFVVKDEKKHVVAHVRTRIIDMDVVSAFEEGIQCPHEVAVAKILVKFTPDHNPDSDLDEDLDEDDDPRDDVLYKFGCLLNTCGTLAEDDDKLWHVLFGYRDANILFVDEVCVLSEEMRGKGIGTWALRRVMQQKSVKRTNIMCCFPGNHEETSCTFRELEKSPRSFWVRKFGFRRIYHSDFFGYARDPTHSSHAITIEQDKAAKTLKEVLPLHAAIMNFDPVESSPDEEKSIRTDIQIAYTTDPNTILQQNAEGDSPLHLAVARQAPLLLRHY